MTQHPPFRLCGGTFFALFAEARTTTGIRSDQLTGKKSGRTEPDLFLALANIIFPNLPNPSQDTRANRNGTRKFKQCENWGWSDARLKDADTREIFSSRLRDEYAAAMHSMEGIVQKFVDMGTQKDEWLCKALILLIEQDDSIPSSREFYAQPDGAPISKEKLCRQDSLYIAPFLLGVWHFCVCCRTDNTCGRETYENWFPQNQSHGRRTFQATFVEESQRKITVLHELPQIPSNQQKQDEAPSSASDASSFAHAEVLPPADAPHTQNVYNLPLSHITINGNGNNIIQGNNNVINNYKD
ncbi:MAG: hypothetical protein MR711_13040 [Selenomonas sp.]|uniref:hypothetical protein n=1 Tax=Selenomonas sp. TaxID=2053611 RepID=UPI0025E7A42C|nr:hypothetical protein [Selenomonas sp.]MCI6087143.1 hypothetical protein [Selenomonas sp.]MDY4417460.1 hypothetical protein [Selenomonas sp.]